MSALDKTNLTIFFEDDNTINLLNLFIIKAENVDIEDEIKKNRLNMSSRIITYIRNSPQTWDKYCEFNIKRIGDKFLESIRDFDLSKLSLVDYIYYTSYRFLCEFVFFNKEENIELYSIKEEIHNDHNDMGSNTKSQIIYASYMMPADILKEFINNKDILAFKDFYSKKSEAEKLKEDWDKEIQLKTTEVNELKNNLEKYKVAFNFVGLYDGFSKLSKTKHDELDLIFYSLVGVALLILIPLIFNTWVIFEGNSSNKLFIDNMSILISLIPIELILIYFFRIILLNYRTVKAQIMQLELRKTLCQFIQDYTKYSEKIKKRDSTSLDKFESLIFSSVLSDPEKLPSTFDGLEQISNFIKKIKS